MSHDRIQRVKSSMHHLEIARSISVIAQASNMLATEIPCTCGGISIPAIALLKVRLFNEIFVDAAYAH